MLQFTYCVCWNTSIRRVAKGEITIHVSNTYVTSNDLVMYSNTYTAAATRVDELFILFLCFYVFGVSLFFVPTARECSWSEAFSVFHFYSHFLAARTRHNSWSGEKSKNYGSCCKEISRLHIFSLHLDVKGSRDQILCIPLFSLIFNSLSFR